MFLKNFIIAMNVKQICDCVYYVGVNDRVTTHFEGLWELPKGVSYNSYIVKGADKTALIDTVAVAEMPEFIDNILRVAEAPQYLVINHMEPDHSGSIAAVVSRFPGIKIVADKIAIGMVKGFYNLDNPDLYIEVKDGSTLDLGGGHVLSFHTTPMVHWPETMMTYLESRGTLFSGDAFGTFGSLDGGTPSDLDGTFAVFEPEMRRYYAAIVGKYSPFVQKAFAKLDGLKIDYICSTHGPVWHKHISDVIALYDRMSRQDPDDGVVIVYGSMYGNTQRMVERFATMLSERGVEVKRVFNAGETEMSFMLAEAWRYKGIVIASPTYSMDLFPPVEAFVKALEVRDIKNRVVAALGSYAWAPKLAADRIADRMAALRLDVAGKVSMSMSLNSKTEEELTALADCFAEKLR